MPYPAMLRIDDWPSRGMATAGRCLIAAPMLIFPVLHFVYPKFVASIIPPWIPWHMFWTYFTAVTIFAAGLSILFEKHPYWPAALLATEIFLFCVLIHVFLLFHGTGDAWAERPMQGFWAQWSHLLFCRNPIASLANIGSR
jgi:uncharacterized membrane protein